MTISVCNYSNYGMEFHKGQNVFKDWELNDEMHSADDRFV